MVCPAGAEKSVHGLRLCISEHWEDDDFVACKIDLRNAFNEISRQALLEECATHFPDIFRWVFGVMDNTPPCGTPWALLDLNKEFSRETLCVHSSSA